MKKIISVLCAVSAILLLFASCAGTSPDTQTTDSPSGETADNVLQSTPADSLSLVKAGFLQGPTGMGAAYLLSQNEAELTEGHYDIRLDADPTSFTAALINGELDMAALPVNAAATLYAKTMGKVRILAVNTLGVMYLLDASGEINSLSDLAGKTILSAGQGSTPEYVLDHLLRANGLEVGKDVTVEYAAEHAEVVAQALAGKYDVILLPEPFVTKIRQKNADFNIAVDLTDEWAKLGNGELLTGCVAVRSDFADAHPEEIKAFLTDYEASVRYALTESEDAARLMGHYGIIDAETALTALPNCNITFMAGEQMRDNVAAYLQVLADSDPASVGGKMPEDDFYCLADVSEAK